MLLEKFVCRLRFVNWCKVVLEDELVVLIQKESLEGLDQVSVLDVLVDSCITFPGSIPDWSRCDEAQMPNSSCTDTSPDKPRGWKLLGSLRAG